MVALVFAALVLETGHSPPTSRADFVRAMQSIEVGASMREVAERLGSPDDVLAAEDPFYTRGSCDDVWCYGTDGHRSFPTLGRVGFVKGAVASILGATGDPPALETIDEATLRLGMRALYRPPSPNEDWIREADPLWLVQAANTLIPLGKSRALAVVLEFSRLDGRSGYPQTNDLFFLLRVMFEVPNPPGYMRVPALGYGLSSGPVDQQAMPRFPVAVVDDVPFSLWDFAMMAGSPERIESHVKYFAESCTLRSTRLRPPDDPFLAYQSLVQSSQWSASKADDSALRDVLMLVRSVYRPKEFRNLRQRVNTSDDGRYHAEFLTSHAHWDEQSQTYVRGDGSVLPDVSPASYRAQRWDCSHGGGSFTAQVIRLDDTTVAMELTPDLSDGMSYHSEYSVCEADGTLRQWGATTHGSSRSESRKPPRFKTRSPQILHAPQGAYMDVRVKLGDKAFAHRIVF